MIVKKMTAALVLTAHFLVAVAISGIQTVRIIFLGRKRPRAGFVRMRFGPMTETGAALLGSLITLTPGTTTIDIDMKRRELLMHFLDTSQTEASIQSIRDSFERALLVLFGTEEKK